MIDPIPALSIRQPWAWAILAGHKPVENRTWSTRYRGPLIIHAARMVDEEARAAFVAQGWPLPSTLQTGGFVGIARLVDVVSHHESAFFTGPRAWVLADPVPFQKPIEGRGKLGLFVPPPELRERILAAARWAAFDMGEAAGGAG